jgi:hypothetical protein
MFSVVGYMWALSKGTRGEYGSEWVRNLWMEDNFRTVCTGDMPNLSFLKKVHCSSNVKGIFNARFLSNAESRVFLSHIPSPDLDSSLHSW